MIRDTSWMDRAVCAQIGPAPFHPPKSSRPSAAARAVCAVRVDCLDYALDEFNAGTDIGVWGGLSVEERRHERNQR